MGTAAERKARQRERDQLLIAEASPDQWTERHCLAILADPRWRTGNGAMARSAWERLGDLRGWRDGHTSSVEA